MSLPFLTLKSLSCSPGVATKLPLPSHSFHVIALVSSLLSYESLSGCQLLTSFFAHHELARLLAIWLLPTLSLTLPLIFSASLPHSPLPYANRILDDYDAQSNLAQSSIKNNAQVSNYLCSICSIYAFIKIKTFVTWICTC